MRVTYKENNGGDLKHPLKLGVIRITQEIKWGNPKINPLESNGPTRVRSGGWTWYLEFPYFIAIQQHILSTLLILLTVVVACFQSIIIRSFWWLSMMRKTCFAFLWTPKMLSRYLHLLIKIIHTLFSNRIRNCILDWPMTMIKFHLIC